MARKLPRLQRVLDAPALASVAYGEVASSLYFALGIVALHALGLTIGVHSIAQRPGDVIVGCVMIVAIALVRLFRRTRLYSFSLVVPVLDLVTQLLLVLLGFAFLFSPSALTRGLHVGTQPSWHQIAFALPLAFLA